MQMHTDAQILMQDVSFTYDESASPALSHISAKIRQGEFVAVLGHNGSGKSTLAKLINALYIPGEGNVVVCGYDTKNEKLVWEIRRRAGMIFQNPDNQIVATVVKEDVAFGLENLGVPTEEMIPRIEQALSAVRMSKYADSAPHILSGGQKQRVAIAGILAMEPSVIIADEATAMLDPSGRKEVLETVQMLNRSKGITVLWITHFMEEAALADRVLVVTDGKIQLEGTPAQVFDRVKEMKEMHLDVPPMAALADDLRKEGMPLPGGILTVEDMVREVEKVLCPLKSAT
jgi:energy-coupling factor transport system ATP-binding protein